MKILKTLGIIVLVLIASALILAAITKKEYSVTRSVVIKKPVNDVYNFIKYLKNQEEYSVWAKIDPNMKKSYQGIDATSGFISSWDSKMDEAGAGEQEILMLYPNEKINYEIRFIRPFKSTSLASMELKPVDSISTNLKWTFDGKMSYPMNLMLVIFNMDEQIGNDLAGGLSNLKLILEK